MVLCHFKNVQARSIDTPARVNRAFRELLALYAFGLGLIIHATFNHIEGFYVIKSTRFFRRLSPR